MDVEPTPHKPSVTRWINDFREGDDSAAALLWGFLQSRLVSFASRKTNAANGAYDEEDVAIGAFAALCDGLQGGRYDKIGDRESLWSLLAVITINRAKKLARDENRLCRGGDSKRVVDSEIALDVAMSFEPTPEFSLLAKDECSRMLNLLPKKELRMVAILKVDGHTNDEVAKILGCTRRSIQRRLKLIRDIWINELPIDQLR